MKVSPELKAIEQNGCNCLNSRRKCQLRQGVTQGHDVTKCSHCGWWSWCRNACSPHRIVVAPSLHSSEHKTLFFRGAENLQDRSAASSCLHHNFAEATDQAKKGSSSVLSVQYFHIVWLCFSCQWEKPIWGPARCSL